MHGLCGTCTEQVEFLELHKILDDAWIRYCTNYRLHMDLVLYNYPGELFYRYRYLRRCMDSVEYNYPGNCSTGTVILDDAWTLWNCTKF